MREVSLKSETRSRSGRPIDERHQPACEPVPLLLCRSPPSLLLRAAGAATRDGGVRQGERGPVEGGRVDMSVSDKFNKDSLFRYMYRGGGAEMKNKC